MFNNLFNKCISMQQTLQMSIVPLWSVPFFETAPESFAAGGKPGLKSSIKQFKPHAAQQYAWRVTWWRVTCHAPTCPGRQHTHHQHTRTGKQPRKEQCVGPVSGTSERERCVSGTGERKLLDATKVQQRILCSCGRVSCDAAVSHYLLLLYGCFVWELG